MNFCLGSYLNIQKNNPFTYNIFNAHEILDYKRVIFSYITKFLSYSPLCYLKFFPECTNQHCKLLSLRQKRELKNGTFLSQLKATMSMMYLWPLGNFFKGFRVISFVDSAQTSLLLIIKMPLPEEKGRQNHLHACRSL